MTDEPTGHDRVRYHDGEPVSLVVLCMREPDWAANRIHVLERELRDARAEIDAWDKVFGGMHFGVFNGAHMAGRRTGREMIALSLAGGARLVDAKERG